MPTVNETAEFFVVGGPLRPEEACYVVRQADRDLKAAIRERQLCCVLGPPGVGKSSLAMRVAAALRSEGELAAVVTAETVAAAVAAGSVDESVRALALAVARDLGMATPADKWWRAQSAPVDPAQLAAFLRDTAVAAAKAPVTIFVDDIEVLLGAPCGADVLAAIGLCQARGANDPAFARLRFVVLGTAVRRQLAGRDAASPFAAARTVELGDFTAEEAYRLAAGFSGGREQVQALIDRVCVWTSGHPYLTQRVARGVARKGGRLEDVERVVREQLLAPGAAEAEPLLARLRDDLQAGTPAARRAANLLRRAAGGAQVAAPGDVKVLDVLHLAGAAVLDADGRLAPRNRIVRELAVAGWLARSRRGWRIAAAAAAVAALGVAGAFWYTQYLPQADLAMLTSAEAAVADASAAYERLHALPGFAERADELFGAALVRASGKAATLGEASAVDARLRALPGRSAVADGLFAEYWLRRAHGAANAERRDAAVLFALRAAEQPSTQQDAAAAYVRELVADDYPALERSLRLGAAPVAWRMLFDEHAVVLLDAERQMLRIPFGGAAANDANGASPQRLTALAHEALRRDLAVDGDGSAGDLELTLLLQHPAGAELLVTLTAPSGAQATVDVPASASGALETFVFPAAPGSPLGGLADEARRGVWSLTVVDRSTDNIGTLSGWGLRFGADVAEDFPELPLAIPDPQRTEAVTLDIEGTFALARPAQAGAVGTVALWDLAAQRLAHDLTLPAVPRTVAVSASGERLIAATANVATVFDTASGRPAARLATDTEFVLPPVFSPDGAYFAIAERVDGAAPLFSVLRAADASLVASFEGAADARSWQLGPGARWVAVTGADGVVSVVESGRGARIARLVATRAFARLLPLGDGTRVLTIDAGGELVVASLVGAAPLRLGVTVAPASVSVAADGARVAYADEGGAVVVATATGVLLQRVRHESDAPLLGTQLAAEGAELVTAAAQELRLWSAPTIAPEALQRRPDSRARPTAFAVARGTELVAVGFDSGQLEIVAPAELATAGAQRLSYFGHRGAVTAVAVAAERGLAATGGSDGIVRLWDTAGGVPVGIVMQPAEAPIARIALAADGRWVASATAQSVRIAGAADGRVVHAFTVDAAVTALEFAPASGALAIGDAGGGVTFVALDDGRRVWSSRVAAGVAALAFGGETIAVGDAGGGVRLLSAGDGSARGAGIEFSQGVRWLDWSDAAGTVLVATRDWLHAAGGDDLAPLHGRLAPHSIAGAMLAAGAGTAVRLVAPDAAGVLEAATIDVAALPAAAAASPLAARDWPAALGLQLDAAGEPVAFDP